MKDVPAGETRVLRGVEANARLSMHQLLDTPLIKDKVARHELLVKAAVYELATGKVRILD